MERKSNYPINQLFLKRWSPRAMSGEAVNDEELMTLFEAARWAPSSYNGQPWRFIYAKRDSANWGKFFDLMVEFNQGWAKTAGALVVVFSAKNFSFNGEPAVTHSFDSGSAWMSLALQGADMGLLAHGMQGFDYEKAREVLGVPEDHTVEAMVAIGKLGNKENLVPDLQEKEAPSDRKPLEEIVMEGKFQE